MSLREELVERLHAAWSSADDGVEFDAPWEAMADECIRQMEHARRVQSRAYMRADGKVGYWEPRNYEWPPLSLAPAESSDARMQPPPMKDEGPMTPEVEVGEPGERTP